MRFRIQTLVIALVIGLLAAGCTVSVGDGNGGGNGGPDYDFDASDGFPTSARSIQIPANDSVLIRIDNVSTAQDAVYFELDEVANLEMGLLTSSTGDFIASSTSDLYFRDDELALSSAATATAAPQVAPVDVCEGVCIISRANRSVFYLEVFNRSGFSQTVGLYAYTGAFADEFEFGNNTAPGAGLGGSEPGNNSGAIEYIGDEDFWEILETGDLFFNALAAKPAEIQLRLDLCFEDAGGVTCETYSPDDGPISAFEGDIAIVYELGNDAAGPSGSSQYFLEINPF